MGKVLVDETNLTNIANSIRNKNGKTTTYKPSEMASAIDNITGGGGNYQTKNIVIDRNGNTSVSPDEGYDALNEINITTNVSSELTDYFNTEINTSNGATKIIKKLPTIHVTNATYFFSNVGQAWFNVIVPYIELDTKDMTRMFASGVNSDNTNIVINDTSLLSSLDVSKVENMSYAFANNTALSSLIGIKDWNISNVKNMSGMFSLNGSASGSFSVSAIKDWDVSNVTDMSSLFMNRTSLTDINDLLNTWDTSSVQNLSSMFRMCRNIYFDNLSHIDTSHVTNMTYLFDGTYPGYINIPSTKDWDTSNVTTFQNVMSSMSGTTGTKYKELNVDLNWNVDKANSFYNAFTNRAEIITFSGLYTTIDSTTTITFQNAFNNCTNLKEVDINCLARKCSNISSMFNGCKSLELIDISGLTCSNLSSSSYYSNALYNVPTTVKIVVKDETEKTWWKSKFSAWSNCFVTRDEFYEPIMLSGVNDILIECGSTMELSFKFKGTSSDIENENLSCNITTDSENTEISNVVIDYEKMTIYYTISCNETSSGNYQLTVSVSDTLGNNESVTASLKTKAFSPTYAVDALSYSYPFRLNSNGYWESSNKGVSNSYSLCKVNFNTDGGHLYVDCINYAESSYDYGILSNIGATLSASSSSDSVFFKSFRGSQSPNIQTVDYGVVPAGDKFIYIKFIKDGTTNSNNDSLQFKIRIEET